MTAVWVACGLAVVLLLYATTLRLREKALRRRLVPIEARLLDPGIQGAVSASDQAWADMQNASRDNAIRQGHDRDSFMPTTAPTMYTAVWEFELDGRTYRRSFESATPVFSPDQARAKRVQVWYDRSNPAVSVVRPGAADAAWAWFIAAGIVAVFALIFLFFATVVAPADPHAYDGPASR